MKKSLSNSIGFLAYFRLFCDSFTLFQFDLSKDLALLFFIILPIKDQFTEALPRVFELPELHPFPSLRRSLQWVLDPQQHHEKSGNIGGFDNIVPRSQQLKSRLHQTLLVL